MSFQSILSTPARWIIRIVGLVVVIGAIGTGLAPGANAEIVTPPNELTRVYKANDGSLLYTRAVGTKVVGYGEKANALAFVFEGTRSGTTITATWWDLPEAARALSGSMTLTIRGTGTTLNRTGGDDPGPDSWTAVSKTDVVYPGSFVPARFQSKVSGDIDGAFSGSNGSRAYANERNGVVTFVADLNDGVGLPTALTVFVGKRVSSTGITGNFYDLPIGDWQRVGTFSATEGPNRALTIATAAGNVVTPVAYAPDYAVNIARLMAEIHERFDGKAIGYSFAITKRGKSQGRDSRGLRSVPQFYDPPGEPMLPFQNETQIDVASTSKTVTAVAVARALEQKGLSLDTEIKWYLPVQWTWHWSINGLTFRQLLHHDGLKSPGIICKTDFYQCHRDAIALGRTWTTDYDNINYSIMRYLLPFVVDKEKMVELFASHDTNTDGAMLNEAVSNEFRTYVVKMLQEQYVQGTFHFTSYNAANGYKWDGTNEKILSDGDEDDYLEAGPGWMKFTAAQYANFLTKFEEGKFVSPATVRAMKEGSLGFDQIYGSGKWTSSKYPALGLLHSKNGSSRGAFSESFIAPSGLQVYVMGTGTSYKANLLPGLLLAAYEEALI